MPAECKVCLHPDMETIEAMGLRAEAKEIPWSDIVAAYPDDFTHIKGIQNHMQRHYVTPPTATDVALEDYDGLLADTIRELQEQAALAPAEVKPFYVIAIQNLKGLDQTKPSQQHLINALKGIHEVTGMKMEQRLMLDFAKHHFGQVGPAATEAIEQHTGVIEVDEAD